MPHTQTHLQQQIARSLLLADERKAELLAVLPTLTEEWEGRLEILLAGEEDIVRELTRQAIASAVERKDAAFLEELDLFLHDALKDLRKAEEGAERGEEQGNAEHLFDDVP